VRRRFLLLENPRAGAGRREFVDAAVAALVKRGTSVERIVTQSPAHTGEAARDGAKSDRFDALIVAGGDGTIRDAATGLLGRALPFGVIPAGTGNVLAAELRLPREPQGLAEYLCAGKAHAVTGGSANGELFLFMAGIGLDAEIVSRLHPRLARRIGKTAYAPAILSALAGAPRPHLTVRLGNETIPAEWAIVAKSSRFAGPFLLTRKAGLLKPGLQLVSVAGNWRLGDAIRLAALPFGMLERMPGVRIDACARAVIESDRPTPVQIDGDMFGTTPVEVGPAPAPVNVIVPGWGGMI
jgi:diacylglycerol kinase family enzyme